MCLRQEIANRQVAPGGGDPVEAYVVDLARAGREFFIPALTLVKRLQRIEGACGNTRVTAFNLFQALPEAWVVKIVGQP